MISYMYIQIQMFKCLYFVRHSLIIPGFTHIMLHFNCKSVVLYYRLLIYVLFKVSQKFSTPWLPCRSAVMTVLHENILIVLSLAPLDNLFAIHFGLAVEYE